MFLLIKTLSQEFALKDLGNLHYFLGLEVHRKENYLLLNQDKYAAGLLKRVGMDICTPYPTPLSTTNTLSLRDGSPLSSDDSTRYKVLWVLYSI